MVRDLGLTSQQVWGLTKTDKEWSAELEAELTAARPRTWSTAPTPRTSTVVCAGTAGSISSGVWAGASGGNCTPLDCDELERWTRVGFERGMRSPKGER